MKKPDYFFNHKTLTRFLFTISFIFIFQSLFGQMTYVPNDNFEQALIDLGYDSGELNDSVPTENIIGITDLNINNKNISNITGIEDFIYLRVFSCNSNHLTDLDISKNIALAFLSCTNNQLTSLDYSNNIELYGLYCSANKLTFESLEPAVSFEKFNCSPQDSVGISLAITKKEKENYSYTLEVGGNYNQYQWHKDGAVLPLQTSTTLNLPNLSASDVGVYHCKITNTVVTGLTLNSKKITLSINGSMQGMTYVPDDNFEQALIDLGYDSGELNDSVLTEVIISITHLNVENKNISDLTGIESFSNLTWLNCNDNQLTGIDVSKNTALTNLFCDNNQLTILDVSQNIALLELGCVNNQITSLDVSQNNALSWLDCSVNQLTDLDVSQNLALSWLCSNKNQLISIDLNQNTALSHLELNSNQIVSLDITNNKSLTRLLCYENQLTDLDVSQNISLFQFGVGGNQLTRLDVSQNDALVILNCGGNQLASIDVSHNTALAFFVCSGNQIQSLDVSQNPNLENLNCAFNNLSFLNIKNGNNSVLTRFESPFNPNLICIQVDDAQAATAYPNWIKDETASYSENCNSEPMTYVPDDNFEQALIDLGYDSGELNDSVPTINIKEVKELYLESKNIADLTGIEDFTALTELLCYDNQLTSLDVSTNTALTILSCGGNRLTALDVSSNIALTELYCLSNQLVTLDVSSNTSLLRLECGSNQLTALDVSANTALTVLECAVNQLTTLDVSSSSALTYLDCNWNQITALDISSSSALEYLRCYSNQLTTLDVSFNTALTQLECGMNWLTSLDVSSNTALKNIVCSNNQLSALNVSSNTELAALYCTNNQLTSLNLKNGNNHNMNFGDGGTYTFNNPNLHCIQVDDPVAAAGYANWQKDATASYSVDCSSELMTYVPDDNFEQALIDLGYDSGALNDSVPTASINIVTILDISSKNIVDLTGLEDFTALTEFNCYNNQLTTLDVSFNTALTSLNCNGNQLTALDVTNNTDLMILRCRGNQLMALDATNNNDLTFLDCHNNQLTALDISSNTNLTFLKCISNQFTDLDISNNTDLTWLECGDNRLSALVVTKNTALTFLECSNNQLTELDVSYNTALTELWCHNNQLIALDLSLNSALIKLWCSRNQLISLNIKNGNNSNLTDFRSSSNPNLTCIEVDDAEAAAGYSIWVKDATANYSENCSSVTMTYVPDDNFEQALIDLGYDSGELNDSVSTSNISGITELHVSGKNISDLSGIEDFSALEILDCAGNQLSSLDISQNINLTFLDCSHNQLINLDISKNIALTHLDCFLNQLTNLDFSENINLEYVHCVNNNLTNLNVSKNIALTNLYCGVNQLASLDVSQNTNLALFGCDENQLSSLDISNNLALIGIDCMSNQLTNLDVSKNLALENLNCHFNQLTSLDISHNNDLKVLYCGENQLITLDISKNQSLTEFWCNANNLTELNIKNGNNNNLADFDASNNPNLTCLQVDNAEAAAGYSNWTKDTNASYSENCVAEPMTYVPDDNFEQALIDLGYDSDALDDYVPTANISGVTLLDINGKNISDLTGIEDFAALRNLNCSANNLSDFDMSQNIFLYDLDCSDNQLTNLDFSKNFVLESLYCKNNLITSIGLSSNFKLLKLDCSNNQLISLNLSPNYLLKAVWCKSNNLSELNIKNGSNINLIDFDASNNPNLTCIEVDDAEAASGYLNWTKDETASYSENCSSDCNVQVSQYYYYFDAAGGSDSVELAANDNCGWTATPLCEWVTISSGGNGNGKIVFSVEENLSTNERECYIAVENDTFYVIQKGSILLSNEADILNFSTEGQQGETVISDGKVFLTMPFNSSLSALVPQIEVSDGASISPESGVAMDFTSPVNYKVTAQNNETTKDWIVYIDLAPKINSSDSIVINDLIETYAMLPNLWESDSVITVSGNYVTELNLSYRGLEGKVPSLFAELDSLKRLDLSHNNLSGSLPEIFGDIDDGLKTALLENSLTLDYLNISYNHFLFSDLEGVWDKLIQVPEFVYHPQENLFDDIDTTIFHNTTFTINLTNYTSSASDKLKWFKNGIEINGEFDTTLNLQNIAYSDSGFYHCEITNTLIPDLTLNSGMINLHVENTTFASKSNLRNLKIYPNPTIGKIKIEGLKPEMDKYLSILNTKGQLIEQKQITSNEMIIDISGKHSGIYILVVDGNKTESYMIVKE